MDNKGKISNGVKEKEESLESVDEKEPKLYELGFLLSPLIPEDKVSDEVARIRSIIEKSKGLITNEDLPKSRSLAYPIKKETTAYFGWIRFMVRSGSILEIKDDLDKDGNVLRFLMIKVKQKVITKKPKLMRLRKIIKEDPEPVSTAEKAAKEKEIDKRLEELVGI